MGWIDDELDVEAALKGKPEAKAFDRVLQRLRQCETAMEKAESELLIFMQAAAVIKGWFDDSDRS